MSSSDLSLSKAAKTRFALLGCGIMAAVAAGATLASLQFDPPSNYYNATFDRAGQGLDSKSLVKVRGMTVGAVQSVTLDPQGRARVRFRVDKDIKVPTTVSAVVQPVSVFGPKDINLDLGSGEGTGPYLKSGATITRTVDPAELADTGRPIADLTAAIDPDDVSTVVHTLAAALRGNGEKLRRTTDNGQKVLEVLYGNRKSTTRALEDASALAKVLGGRSDKIGDIIQDAAALNDTLADDTESFQKTLDNARILAGTLSRTLKDNGDDLALLIDKGALLNQSLSTRQTELVALINGLNSLFGGLASIMQLEGPDGTRLGNTTLYVSLNLCDEFPDLCPPEWTHTDQDDPKRKKKGGNG